MEDEVIVLEAAQTRPQFQKAKRNSLIHRDLVYPERWE
jgi:hypothetical protein